MNVWVLWSLVVVGGVCVGAGGTFLAMWQWIVPRYVDQYLDDVFRAASEDPTSKNLTMAEAWTNRAKATKGTSQ